MTTRHAPNGVVLALVLALALAPVVAMPAAGQSSDTVTITVSVVTERGTAVGGATVAASWDGGSTKTTTASNGKVFVDVPAGATVALDVNHDRYTRNFPYRVTVDGDRDVSVTVKEAVSLGYVVSNADGEAVSGATVTVLDGGQRVVARGTTDASGRYATGSIEAGSYRVRIAKPGFYNYTATSELAQSAIRQVTLERGTANLTVAVTDPHFDPPRAVPNATVTVGDIGTVRTGSNGLARLGVPVNSRVEVTVEKPGYRTTTREVTLGEETPRVSVQTGRKSNLTLSPANRRIVVGETVVAEVRDAYGDPASNVTVLLDGEAVGTTNAQGEIEVPVDSAGSHELRARGSGVYSNRVTIEGVRAADASTTSTAVTVDDTGTSESLAPGFGVVTALAALVVALGGRYASRRR